MLLEEISEVYIGNTAFKTTKAAKIYCWQRKIPHFDNSQQKI